ncbi:hypothetical protein [Nostoc sp. FACHB-110]|uniref:hypothetical protein n=1 Tax=Nostoc sp. FACHB-110 TaxID=2692834 RepID=UPI001686DEB0|nr:hypothetical protein [Nostoc sp. FACHB-110]MBD2441190.1 hypothetical protein [Nostoc sp. FACHB-110]
MWHFNHNFLYKFISYITSFLSDIPKVIAVGIASYLIFGIYLINFYRPQNVNSKSLVDHKGIGTIKVGMTVERAEEVSHVQLLPVSSSGLANPNCYYVEPQSGLGLNYVKFMVVKGQLVTIEVNRNRTLATTLGAKVGQSNRQIESLYGKEIHSLLNSDNQEYKLSFQPSQDKNYRIIFESNGSYVTGYRAGKLPEVQYSNGCSDFSK